MAHTRHSARLSFEDLEARDVPATAGTLDTTFGINGQINLSTPQPGVASPIETAFGSVVQSDGKIIMVGTVGPSLTGPNQYNGGSPSPDFAAVRLNVNGSLDTTFGKNGLTRIPFDIGASAKDDQAYSVGLQSDGHIVISGYAATFDSGVPGFPEANWAVTRLDPDGSLDTTFGTNGLVNFYFNGIIDDTQPGDMVIGANDNITLAGNPDITNQNSFEIVQLTPRGLFNPFFGTPPQPIGQVTITNPTPLPGGAVAAYAGPFDHITAGPNGSFIVAGRIVNRAGDYVIAKVTAGGVLDTTFGVLDASGKAHTGFAFANLNPIDPLTGSPGVVNATVGDVTTDASGNILVTGQVNGDFTTVRFTPAGVLDKTFGVKGVSTVAFDLGGSNSDKAESIAIQPDGKIVLGGEAQTGTDSPNVFAAARLTAAGTLDSTFGKGGKQTYAINNPSTLTTGVAARSLDFTTGGKILLVGQSATQAVAIQLLNNVSFDPLPPPPAPPTGVSPPVQDPGTTVSQIAVGSTGAQLLTYQPPNPATFQYDPSKASNLGALGAMQLFTAGFTGIVRSAVGDVDGDSIPDYAVVTGPGTVTRFAVISGANPNQYIIAPQPAFQGSEDFTGGAYVSVGDLNGDGRAEVVISADTGGGPRITIYSFFPATNAQNGPPRVPAQAAHSGVLANFLGIADVNFRGGARTAIGDINGDGIPDLAVAAGLGGGPRIALFDGNTVFTTQGKLINDFFAFTPTLKDGAYVAIGDVDGDGFKDLIFGAGDGGAPRILAVGGQKLVENAGTALTSPITSFFMNGDTTSRGGVRIAVKNVDGDSKADIVAGSGDDQVSQVRVYRGSSVRKAGEPTAFQDLDPFNAVLADGVFVG
jgi:uncharacterized delta-60 repeat protein